MEVSQSRGPTDGREVDDGAGLESVFINLKPHSFSSPVKAFHRHIHVLSFPHNVQGFYCERKEQPAWIWSGQSGLGSDWSEFPHRPITLSEPQRTLGPDPSFAFTIKAELRSVFTC